MGIRMEEKGATFDEFLKKIHGICGPGTHFDLFLQS